MRDPKQLFVINAVTREGIAEDLNDTLDGYANEERFTPNDDRLTDEICAAYAAALGNIDEDMPRAAQEDAACNAAEAAIEATGITLVDD